MTFADIGVVYSITGTSITSGYTGAGLGSIVDIGAAARATFTSSITTAAGSSLTSVTMKLQATSDGTHFWDVASKKFADGTMELEHVYGVSANSTYTFGFGFDAESMPLSLQGFRVCCKAAGGGSVGDSINVACAAW